MIGIQAYLCEHCAKGKRNRGTTYRTLRAATKHEAVCFFNPEMRACVTCKSFTAGKGGGPDDPPDPPYCAKGHDLERRYASPDGDMAGGLRNHCEDWEGRP